MEAEEDDEEGDDEEGDGEDEAEAGFVEDIAQEDVGRREDTNLYRNLINRQDVSEEELARQISERYKNYNEQADEVDFEATESDIARQSLLPTIKDPKIWAFKCKPGFERQIVVAVMNKYFHLRDTDHPLLICSVIAADHIQGKIYVEATKEVYAKEAVEGVPNVYKFAYQLVKLSEMPDILKVPSKLHKIKKGDWIRPKRGIYKGDIGQVEQYIEAKGTVLVKLIPRISIAQYYKKMQEKEEEEENEEKNGEKEGENGTNAANKNDANKKKRKRTNTGPIPPPKFFDVQELKPYNNNENVYLETKKDKVYRQDFIIFDNQRFDKDGFLYKPMNVKTLQIDGVQPTLDESIRFQIKQGQANMFSGAEGEEDEDLNILKQVAPRMANLKKKSFQKHDTVKVIEGELKNLMGVVFSVDGDNVTIMPKHDELKDMLTIPASQLQKYFKEGDHVKVLSGKFEGETGLITKVEDNVAILFSDMTKKELKVLTSDIQEASEVSTGGLKLGNYELHDLVQTGPQSVGMIIRVDRDGFMVLDTSGVTKKIRLQEMGNKRNLKTAVAFDANQNPIHVDDVIRIIDGPHKNLQASVKHVYRFFAFVQSRDLAENGGILVVKTRSCAKAGPTTNAGPQQRVPPQSPYSTQNRANTGAIQPRFRGGGAKVARNDDLLNQSVIIKSGRYKGYVGVVKSANDQTARVELHTQSKTINLPRTDVAVIDAAGNTISGGERGQAPGTRITGVRDGTTAAPSSGDGSGTTEQDYLRLAPPTPRREMKSPGRPETPAHDPWNPAISIPRTPMRPSTPGRDDDNPWTATNRTPATPNDAGWGDSGFGSESYADNFPQTPGASLGNANPRTPHTPHTPGGTIHYPTTPHTPGGGIPHTPHTPGGGVPHTPNTPSGGVPRTPHTPSGGVPHTPQGQQGRSYGEQHPVTPGFPHTPHTPHTPGGGSSGVPMTPTNLPNTPSTPQGFPHTPFTPQTPGGVMNYPHTPNTPGGDDLRASTASTGGGDDEDNEFGWVSNDIMVTVEGTGKETEKEKSSSKTLGKTGFITNYTSQNVTIDIGGSEITVPISSIKPVAPEKKDKVKIIRGEFKGKIGTVIGVDGGDFIIKMDENLDIKILASAFIAKIHT